MLPNQQSIFKPYSQSNLKPGSQSIFKPHDQSN
jgi:hypothetical protein